GSVATDQSRRKMVAQQGNDRRAAGAYGVSVARAACAVAVENPDNGRLLRDERLNDVSSSDLWLEIDEDDLDALDVRHWRAATSEDDEIDRWRRPIPGRFRVHAPSARRPQRRRIRLQATPDAGRRRIESGKPRRNGPEQSCTAGDESLLCSRAVH